MDPRLWAGLPISGLLLWLAARGISANELFKAIRGANYGWITLAVIFTYGVIWVRARRWCVLLRGIQRVRASTAFQATAIGFTVNYVFPVRAGELLRAYLVGSKEGISRSAAFATVVVERLLDVISILIVFLTLLICVPVSQRGSHVFSLFRTAALISVVICLGLGVFIWVLRKRQRWIGTPLEKLMGGIWPRATERIKGLLEGFSRGLIPTMALGDMIAIFLYTVALWALTAAGIWIVAYGFGIGLPWEAPLVILVALAFGVSVPSAPGFLGTFHYAAMVALMLYGVPKTEALSYAITLHATSILPVFLLGIVLIWSQGLQVGRLLHRQA